LSRGLSIFLYFVPIIELSLLGWALVAMRTTGSGSLTSKNSYLRANISLPPWKRFEEVSWCDLGISPWGRGREGGW